MRFILDYMKLKIKIIQTMSISYQFAEVERKRLMGSLSIFFLPESLFWFWFSCFSSCVWLLSLFHWPCFCLHQTLFSSSYHLPELFIRGVDKLTCLLKIVLFKIEWRPHYYFSKFSNINKSFHSKCRWNTICTFFNNKFANRLLFSFKHRGSKFEFARVVVLLLYSSGSFYQLRVDFAKMLLKDIYLMFVVKEFVQTEC